MMVEIAYVALGGAFGATLRYLAEWLIKSPLMREHALSISLVNLLGCFLMGLFSQLQGPWKSFLLVGLLGALTTFSSFSHHFYRLLEQKGSLWAAAFCTLNLGGALCFYWGGRKLFAIFS